MEYERPKPLLLSDFFILANFRAFTKIKIWKIAAKKINERKIYREK